MSEVRPPNDRFKERQNMIPVVLTQEIVGDDYVELAENFDLGALGARELPWHFDYFDEDGDAES